MARKTKETENPKENIIKNVISKAKKVTTKKKSAEKKDEKKVTPTKKKSTTTKSVSEKKVAKTPKKVVKKVAKEDTKTTTKSTAKSTAKSTEKKSSTTKKTTTKKTASAKKTTSKKASVSTKPQKVDYDNLVKKDFSAEYYDLPFRYNQTVVKILAQTPSKLFIYWDISDDDRANLKKHFGEYFFEITKPVLIIHNKTLNYSFEIDIDDFANSWYLPVNDSDCEYQIELGRRPIPVNYNYIPGYDIEKNGPIEQIEMPFIYITSSNEIESPNDRILFNNTDKIYFRDVKTNRIIEKDIKDFPFINKDGEFISIYQLYKDLYKDVLTDDILGKIDLTNSSSSGNPSSGSLSSRFK